MRPVDLLFLAWNRFEFTQETFSNLLAHTDWALVRELVVWDDGSTDGTREWLRDTARQAPVPWRFVETKLRSPVSVMSQFAAEAQGELLAKVDNDAMLPPGWLTEATAIFDDYPELSLLGLEALYPHFSTPGHRRMYVPTPTVAGLGVYRRQAFAQSRPVALGPWFGFEEWQRRYPTRIAGWMNPAVPVFLLDRLPFEPWQSLTQKYVDHGWQRPWEKYASESDLWHWRWPSMRAAAEAPSDGRPPFDVVILSANGLNLKSCVQALLSHEPTLSPAQIIVVDDGAKKQVCDALPGVRWIEGIRPFVFARNANLGIRQSKRDVILLNDDALLTTPGGFSALAQQVRSHSRLGLLSSAIRGIVGNPRQVAQPGYRLREEPSLLCFVCTYLPRATYNAVGALDERFVGYGFEDDDYSERVRQAGLTLGIYDGCVVDHSGKLPSTFRSRGDHLRRLSQNRRLFQEKRELSTPTSFLGVMRIKNEEKHIGEVLESLLPLCRQVLVFDDHSEDQTADICRSFGKRVELFPSPFQGLDESRDKNFILKSLANRDADWVAWVDGDEVLESSGPERLRALVRQAGPVSVFSLRIAFVWDSARTIRVDGIFGKFRRPSVFRLKGQPLARLVFPETHGVNLHCGNVPQGIVGGVQDTDIRLKHYGYMTSEQRARKYQWYIKVDPDNSSEDCYRHLAGIPGARYAPGPPVFAPWNE